MLGFYMFYFLYFIVLLRLIYECYEFSIKWKIHQMRLYAVLPYLKTRWLCHKIHNKGHTLFHEDVSTNINLSTEYFIGLK